MFRASGHLVLAHAVVVSSCLLPPSISSLSGQSSTSPSVAAVHMDLLTDIVHALPSVPGHSRRVEGREVMAFLTKMGMPGKS